MAYSSIAKPTDHFNTVTYTGNGSSQSITGVGFQPDWVWFKGRSNSADHGLIDAVRGGNKVLRSNSNAAEETYALITSFDTDGFTISNDGGFNNASSVNYVAWSWLAGNSTSSNSNGDLTSTVSVNTTAGFSICQWTSSDTGSVKTVGHGLGVKPDWILWKSSSRTVNWINFHVSTGKDKNAGWLDGTSGSSDQNYWGNTEPTSTVFSTEGATEDSGTNIAYCFAEKKGYSKFGSYTGSGDADGPFVYTGFLPAFVLIKSTASSTNWPIIDNKRPGYNPANQAGNVMFANTNSAESSSATRGADFNSNGFKIRGTNNDINGSSNEIIYMAFAKNPFVGNDSGTAVPVTAG